jgi:hypothetical protein
VYVIVELRYATLLVGTYILCCVVAADVVVVGIGKEFVGDDCKEYVALDVVLLAVDVEGGPVTSVDSW